MFLSIHALGVGSVKTAIPPQQSFSSIKLYGSGYFDELHAQKVILTDEQILSINTNQVWGINTLLLANFENELEAGNLKNNDLPITHWRIKRKLPEELLYKLIAEISYSDIESFYIDYTVKNKVEYEYLVYPVSNGIEGNPIGGIGMSEFWGWILSDGETTYNFDLEINSEDIRVIQDMKLFSNFSKYPAFSFGDQEYREGVLTTMPYELNGNKIDVSLNVLENLRSFINNKQTKILKNPKGEIMNVVTSDFSYKYLDQIGEQPYRISFRFTEVAEV